MGIFDIFLSPQKLIEKENKLLAKPNHTVAEVIHYDSDDCDEPYTNNNGDTEYRTVRKGSIHLRYMIDGQWREEKLGPSEEYVGYSKGEQLIVRHNGERLHHLERALRKDSPNRIEPFKRKDDYRRR